MSPVSPVSVWGIIRTASHVKNINIKYVYKICILNKTSAQVFLQYFLLTFKLKQQRPQYLRTEISKKLYESLRGFFQKPFDVRRTLLSFLFRI